MSDEALPVAGRETRRRRAALAVTLALGLAPILVAGASPQADAVVHLRHAAALRAGGDAHHEVMGTSALLPYQVTYRLMAVTLGLASGEVALIALGAASVLAMAAAALVLTGRAARPSLALLFAGMAYSSVYYDGFLNFRLGQAVALLLLARRLDHPGPRGPWLDVALLGAAYLLHPFALGLGLLALALVRPADPGPWRRAPEVVAALLALVTASSGGGAHGGPAWLLEDLRQGLTGAALAGKLTYLVTEPFARRSPLEGALGLAGLLLAAAALWRRRARDGAPRSEGLVRVIAAVAALYMLLPYFLASVAAVNERFAQTLHLLLVVLLARRALGPLEARPASRDAGARDDDATPAGARPVVLWVAGAALLVAATCCHLRLEALRAEFRPLVEHMAPGRRLVVADLTGGAATSIVTRDYLLVANGVTPHGTFINTLMPTRQRAMPTPRHPEDAAAYLDADYVAVRVAPGRERLPTFAARCREVARAGRWRLLAPARDE